jgi:hypothetical protein
VNSAGCRCHRTAPARTTTATPFSLILAGGGFKAGHVHGATDEVGYRSVVGRVSVPDLHASILHQFGIDHNRLTYHHHGSDETLTDARVSKARVVGEVLQKPPHT